MQWRRLVGLLGLVFLALTAGCSAAGSISMEAVDDAELADEASRAISDLDPAPRDGERSPRDVVTTALRDGTTNVTADRPPLESELPFAFEGAYYNLSHRVVATETALQVSIGIDYNGSDANGRAIAYEDLPAPDRQALDGLLPPKRPPRSDGIDFGIGAIYTAAEANASALVGGTSYDVVVFRGERYPIRVEPPREVTLETYRYEATRIAPNASRYAAQLRESYAFDLEGLSDAERRIISTAVEEGSYYAESDDDSAFAALSERIRSHEAVVRGETSGTWLALYRGQLYVVEIEFGGFRDV